MSQPITQLRIGGIAYRVAYEPDLRNDDDRKIYGAADYPSATITIAEGHDPQVQFVTLMHEALHCILNHAGISEHDEHLIEVMANGIVPLLKDNPQLAGSAGWPDA